MTQGRRTLLATLAVANLVLVVPAVAQDGGARAGPLAEPEVMRTALRWAEAVGQADLAALEVLLHAEYQHVHATALVETRAKFVEALQTGARRYDPIRLEETSVRLFGGAAVVTGRFALRATTRDRVIEGVNRFSLLVVRTPEGAQVASFQATAIAPPR